MYCFCTFPVQQIATYGCFTQTYCSCFWNLHYRLHLYMLRFRVSDVCFGGMKKLYVRINNTRHKMSCRHARLHLCKICRFGSQLPIYAFYGIYGLTPNVPLDQLRLDQMSLTKWGYSKWVKLIEVIPLAAT